MFHSGPAGVNRRGPAAGEATVLLQDGTATGSTLRNAGKA